MNSFEDKTVLITGGTDGIGAASALELSALGASVIIIGRSKEKATAIVDKSKKAGVTGSIIPVIADFSSMKTAQGIAQQIASKIEHLDILIHGVGILITRPDHTDEGIEKDFAVSYLSRFVFTEELFKLGLLRTTTRMINIAASGPKVPSYAKVEFDNLEEVAARIGMKSHGQAQLANDLYTALTAKRYNIIAIGYGPGSVDTSIRREIPKIFRIMMRPFFYFSTRKPEDVAKQFIKILSRNEFKAGKAYFFNKKGQFPIAEFIANKKRQSDLLNTSLKLAQKAIAYKTD